METGLEFFTLIITIALKEVNSEFVQNSITQT